MQVSFTGNNTDPSDSNGQASLSVTVEEFHSGVSKIPVASIKGIWRKAEELLTQKNAIISAPGFENGSKMVLSKDGKRPHLVQVGKGGSISCDSECQNWKSLSVCSHCVAVAHCNDSLREFADFYRKSQHFQSVTPPLQGDHPSEVGNKLENCISRKRKHTELDHYQITNKRYMCTSEHASAL